MLDLQDPVEGVGGVKRAAGGRLRVRQDFARALDARTKRRGQLLQRRLPRLADSRRQPGSEQRFPCEACIRQHRIVKVMREAREEDGCRIGAPGGSQQHTGDGDDRAMLGVVLRRLEHHPPAPGAGGAGSWLCGETGDEARRRPAFVTRARRIREQPSGQPGGHQPSRRAHRVRASCTDRVRRHASHRQGARIEIAKPHRRQRVEHRCPHHVCLGNATHQPCPGRREQSLGDRSLAPGRPDAFQVAQFPQQGQQRRRRLAGRRDTHRGVLSETHPGPTSPAACVPAAGRHARAHARCSSSAP